MSKDETSNTGILPSVLFNARDYLSKEFPELAQYLPDYERVYIVTKSSEAATVKATDPDGHVFDLGAYIAKTTPEMLRDDEVLQKLHQMVPRDRYMRLMAPPQILQIIEGTRRMLEEITARFHIEFYLDEPVSGFVNECINGVVTEQGGVCCHFQSPWLPGHLFFVRDAGQMEPIDLNLLEDSGTKIRAHIGKRHKNQALPTYVLNYNSRLHTFKESVKFALLGVNRKLRKSQYFMDADPWPHFFQARCLWLSLFSRYDSVTELKKIKNAKLVVFPLHYEPEAVIYFLSKYTNQTDLVNAVFDRLPPNAYLVLKEHPSQPGALRLPKWRELVAHDRVKVIRGTDRLADLLDTQSAVVSLGSTAALEAVMLGRPSFVVGTPHFRNIPGITVVENVADLEIDWDAPIVSNEQLAQWYEVFLQKYAVPLQFMRGRTKIDDPVGLLSALGMTARVP